MSLLRKKKTVCLLVAVTILAAVHAQEASQLEQLRIQLWAEMDAYPGLVVNDESNSVFAFAKGRLKELAPFLMGGMINGWNFDYTPSDKVRKVDEYFSYEPALPFDKQVNPIEYRQIEVMEDRLYCWVYCNRTPTQQASYNAWGSIKHPKIHGVGQSKIEDGFDGIKTACEDAMKSAIREYWRGKIKNKPKEITGSVLLIHNPRIYIKEGRYTVDLDFFMETGRIIPYSSY